MRLYKRGNIWWAEFQVDKKTHRYSCKTRDKSVASDVAATIHADTVRQRFNVPAKFKPEYRFEDTWKEYYKSLINSPGQIKNKEFAFRHFFPIFGNKNVAEITKLDIINYQATRHLEIIDMPKNKDKKESEVSFYWLNTEIRILSHFFNYCIEKGIIDKNPTRGVKKLKEIKREIYLSPEEQERLVACAAPHLRNIITFAALTGLRSGDVFGLKWTDIDLGSGICRVFVSKTKQRKVMPLADEAVKMLKGMIRDGEYIFTYKGKAIKSIKTSFATAKKKAGLADRQGLTPHSCRHIFVTRMWEAGADDATIRAATLHMSAEMSARYRHLSPDGLRLREALNKGAEKHKANKVKSEKNN